MNFIYYLFAVTLVLSSCSNNSGEGATSDNVEEQIVLEKTFAVCISNGVAVRAEASKNGKYLSSLNLGETLIYLGTSVIDSSDKNREYYRVELSDETVSWVRSYGILIDAKPAAIITVPAPKV